MKFKLAGALVILLLATRAVAQNDAKQTLYPQHGEVVSSRVATESIGSGGFTGAYHKWVYRVDCGERYYELQGGEKQTLNIGH
jgi:hypothetical protein